MYTEESLKFLATPTVSCPICSSGSSDMSEKIQRAGIWGKVICDSCNEEFEIATAIDEMFVKTCLSGYTLWTGGTQICREITIASGQTHLTNIKGIFEEVYLICPSFENLSCLAGGFDTKFIPQGYAMVSMAPNPDGKINIMKGLINIEGRSASQPIMSLWKRMLLNAKLSIYKSPNLSIILAVNAVDLYLEELTNSDVQPNRPGSWNTLINDHFNIKLSKMLGSDFKNIEKFVQLRNAIAHGREHKDKLPSNLIPLEEAWLNEGKYREGLGAYAPSASYALSCALKVIRSCRRITDNGRYLTVFN